MSELGIPSDGQLSDDFATIPDVPIQAANTPRISPNDIASGVTRGTQTIVGSDSSSITFGAVPNAVQLAMAQYNPSGKKVLQLGQQSDNTSSLKFFDNNGIGLAQFGQYPDGSVALKIAKAGIEVSTATADQLAYNSQQDALKIVKTDVVSLSSWTQSSAGAGYYNTGHVDTIAHGLNILPLATGAVFFDPGYQTLPYTAFQGSAGSGTSTFALFNYSIATDFKNIYISTSVLGYATGAFSGTVDPIAVRYYLLQETAATS